MGNDDDGEDDDDKDGDDNGDEDDVLFNQARALGALHDGVLKNRSAPSVLALSHGGLS